MFFYYPLVTRISWLFSCSKSHKWYTKMEVFSCRNLGSNSPYWNHDCRLQFDCSIWAFQNLDQQFLVSLYQFNLLLVKLYSLDILLDACWCYTSADWGYIWWLLDSGWLTVCRNTRYICILIYTEPNFTSVNIYQLLLCRVLYYARHSGTFHQLQWIQTLHTTYKQNLVKVTHILIIYFVVVIHSRPLACPMDSR